MKKTFISLFAVLFACANLFGETLTVSKANAFGATGNIAQNATLEWAGVHGITFSITNTAKALNKQGDGCLSFSDRSNIKLGWGNIEDGYTFVVNSVSVTLSRQGGGSNYYAQLGSDRQEWSIISTGSKTFNANSEDCAGSEVSLTNGNITCYIHSITFDYTVTPNTYTVTFDAGDGTCATASKDVDYQTTYGTLPVATKAGYNFEGWYTEAVGGTQVLATDTYTTLGDQTLYAHYIQGAVATTIEQLTTELEWNTTYTFEQLFTTNSNGALTVTLGGETINELSIPLFENEVTIHVSQAAVANKFEAAEEDLTFTLVPQAEYPAVILDEYIFEEAATSGNIEAATTYDLFWENTSNEAGIASYQYKTSLMATRSFKVYQQIAGAWVLLDTKSNSGSWRTIEDDELNPAATGIRFEFAGTGLGSAQVQNVKVSRRSSNYLESLAEIDATIVNVLSASVDLPVFYGNVHTVLYELTDIAATNGANATVTMTPAVVPANGEGDFGTYNFVINATSDKAVTTIKANAHFFNAENKSVIVPITINFGVQVTETRSELLNEGVYKYGTICLPLNVEAEEITALAEQAVFYEVTSASPAGAIIEEVSALEAGKAYVFRALAESFTITTVIGEPRTEAIEQEYIHGNLAAQALDVPANDYILSGNMLHQIVVPATATVAQYRAYFSLPNGADIQARLIERSDVVTDIENVETLDLNKFLLNGKVFIRRNGQLFDLNGKLVK